MILFSYCLGVASTLFVIRFKEPLMFWKKRVEGDIETALRGEKK